MSRFFPKKDNCSGHASPGALAFLGKVKNGNDPVDEGFTGIGPAEKGAKPVITQGRTAVTPDLLRHDLNERPGQ